MGVLGDSRILEEVNKKGIVITDFSEDRLNPNSYNLRLGKKLLIYKKDVLDMKKVNETEEIIIPKEGYVLDPKEVYLGETMEYTDCGKYLAMMEGRSSIGRLGLEIHICAGSGDIGYKGKWTLELRATKPIRIYAGVEICQLLFHTVDGDIIHPYDGKYQYASSVKASKLYKDFDK